MVKEMEEMAWCSDIGTGAAANVVPSLLKKVAQEVKLVTCIGNLKCLHLYKCYIPELPESIGNLKELQFLNVSFCGQLPELKCLRAFDINWCQSLELFRRKVSKLVSLERLTMESSSIRLRFEEKEITAERKHACLKDLQSLICLSVFSAADIKSPVKKGIMENWSKMKDPRLAFEEAESQDHFPQDMKAMEDLESLSLTHCDVEQLPSWVIQFRKLTLLCLSDFHR